MLDKIIAEYNYPSDKTILTVLWVAGALLLVSYMLMAKC